MIRLDFIRPSVFFYTGRTVTYISSPENLRSHLERLTTTQAKSSSVLVLSKATDLKKNGLQPNEYANLGSSGAYPLIRIPKPMIAQRKRAIL